MKAPFYYSCSDPARVTTVIGIQEREDSILVTIDARIRQEKLHEVSRGLTSPSGVARVNLAMPSLVSRRHVALVPYDGRKSQFSPRATSVVATYTRRCFPGADSPEFRNWYGERSHLVPPGHSHPCLQSAKQFPSLNRSDPIA